MTPRTALTLAFLAASTAACSRGGAAAPPTPEAGVADVGAAYSCAADAAQQLGYGVPVGVTEAARGERRVGGSFVAERRVALGDGDTQVDDLRVTVRSRGGAGASTLRVAPARFKEGGERGIITSCISPAPSPRWPSPSSPRAQAPTGSSAPIAPPSRATPPPTSPGRRSRPRARRAPTSATRRSTPPPSPRSAPGRPS